MEETKHVSGLKYVLLSIIGCELCERLAFYSLSGNLTLFVRRDLQITTQSSAYMISIWIGIMYICAVGAAYISDVYLNRYRTVMLSALIYFMGLLIVSISTITVENMWNANIELILYVFFIALLLIAIGAGGIKSSVGPLGADQFTNDTCIDLLGIDKKSYWNWFYFAINIGSLIAFTLISYICQNISFSIGYTIPSLCLLVAMCLFFISRQKYIITPPSNTSILIHTDNTDKLILKQIFIFCLLEIMYWMVYSMQSTLFLSQACQMNINLHSLQFQIPIASLDLANIVIILILIPIMDKIVYPYFKNWTILQKIGSGLCFVVLSLICAAIVEVARKQNISENIMSTCNKNLYVSNLSVLWQIPQYLLIGIAEVLTVVNSYNFFFTEAPLHWKSLTYSFNWVSYALGSWLQTILLLLINNTVYWVRNDLNKSKLENYFILCALLLVVDILIFVIYAKIYKYQNIEYPKYTQIATMTKTRSDTSDLFNLDEYTQETHALNAKNANANYDACSTNV